MSTHIHFHNALILTGEANTREEDCACPDGALSLTFDEASGEIENDCACSDRPFTIENTESSDSTFIQTPGTLTSDLPNGFKLAFSPYAPVGPSALNLVAWSRWQDFAHAQPLLDSVDHTLARQRLILPTGSRLVATNADPETLTAWLHITNACNLDCPYCYVRKSSARMNLETGIRAIDRIFETAQTHHFRRVKLKYAGGEATLHFDLVRELHTYALGKSEQTGLGLRAVVLSNGTRLKSEQADWLAATRVKLMISLDGVGATHNRLRAFKGGGASFDVIEKTIDTELLPRGVRPDVTITITGANALGAAEAVEWALARDLPVSLNFYRQNTWSAARADLGLEEHTIIEGMLAAYAVFEKYLPTRSFFNGLLDRVQMQAHTHTCGVGSAYLVITHRGELAQCQMHLDTPVSPTLAGDPLAVTARGPIQNIAVERKSGCRECVYRYRCAGGCAVETFRATGRWDVASPNCRIYKTLMPVALKLEGLHLLKQNGLI